MVSSIRLAAAALNPATVDRLVGGRSTKMFMASALDGLRGLSAHAREQIRVPEQQRRAQLTAVGARFIDSDDAGFPERLRGIEPTVRWVFVRGTELRPGVAVIGSRRATVYGRRIARSIGSLLAASGWSVVSGMAVGIDGEAHRGALAVGGHTTAVLGSGIDIFYPRSHSRLGEEILAAGGTVVSEFPPGTSPEPWRFPARNRIIAGLSEAVVVVEAAERSGALITARLALESGREVLALPGDVERPTSMGCNRLIADGAHPVVSLDELPEMLGWAGVRAPGAAPAEAGADLEALVAGSGLAPSEALRRLGASDTGPA